MPAYKVILFDNWFWHENMAFGYRVVSSGFFEIKNGEVECWGGSQSLEVEAQPEFDKVLIKKYLGL